MQKLTADEWLATTRYLGNIVFDPDGWRKEGLDWDDEITQEEFEKRFNESTVLYVPFGMFSK